MHAFFKINTLIFFILLASIISGLFISNIAFSRLFALEAFFARNHANIKQINAKNFSLIFPKFAFAETVTTTVFMNICGDGIINEGELCDDGALINGQYSTSTENRKCGITCMEWAPYCGDSILQQAYTEQCDDGENVSGDRCSSLCQIEAYPSGAGSGSGSYVGGGYMPLAPTKVVINGKAYPHSNVHILKDGETIGIVRADSKADFHFETTEVTPGITTFGFWAEDKNGTKSIAFTLTFRVVPNAATTVYGAYLPPTINLDKRAVKKGELLDIFGQTVSDAEVHIYVSSEEAIVEKVTSTSAGDWRLSFNTAPLGEEEFHIAKALFQLKAAENIIKSAFSQAVSFYVGEKAAGKCGVPDMNNDTKVNLIDFSIFLYHWGTSNIIADFNCDNKVNLADFSIMLYRWTG